MKNAFGINISPETLSRATSGAITGRLSVTIDGLDYPEKEWSDFIVIVLSWWIDEILSILKQESDNAICEFMDGSYEFAIDRIDQRDWKISFVEKIKSGKRQANITINSSMVTDSLLKTSRRVLQACKANHWTDSVIKNFENKIQHLGEAIYRSIQ